MMHLSLQPLLRSENESIAWETTIKMDDLCQEVSHLQKLEPVRAKGLVKKTKTNLYQLTGELSTQVTYICSRCLKEFALPLSTQWEEQVMTNEELNNVEEEIQVIEGNDLDLLPFIREALLLKIPFAPICQEACRGLCPICGVDRNETTCDCQEEMIDPRWLKLKSLSKEG